MVVNYALAGTVLLISFLVMTGCTVSSPAEVAVPATLSVAAPAQTSPAPLLTTLPAPLTTVMTILPEPVTDHPYSKMYTFEGTGDYPHTFTTDSDRMWTFRMNYPGNEDFTVRLQDDQGDMIAMLADTRGSYTGTQSVWLEAGTYTLDVSAGSPWTIGMATG